MTNDNLLQEMVKGRTDLRRSKLDGAKALWNARPEHGYLLTFAGPAQDRPHTFCPPDLIAGADCPNCDKPLLRVVTFDTARLPFELGPHTPKVLHILYCWTCAIPYDFFSYHVGPTGEVQIIDYCSGDRHLEGPYDGYTGAFSPSRVGLRALTPQEEELSLELRAKGEFPRSLEHLWDAVHQVGGFPMIDNPRKDVRCPRCGCQSPFFATFADNTEGQEFQPDPMKTFTHNCGVQTVFHCCPECSVFTAYRSCD